MLRDFLDHFSILDELRGVTRVRAAEILVLTEDFYGRLVIEGSGRVMTMGYKVWQCKH